jgi:lipoprotein-anchoring transpeptidase ErfK/SrfK
MTDYETMLRQAVAKLHADKPGRARFYERASTLLQQRLEAMDPPRSRIAILAELAAFGEAVRRIEREIEGGEASEPETQAESSEPLEEQAPQQDQEVASEAARGAAFSRRSVALIVAAIVVLGAVGGLAMLWPTGGAEPSKPAAVIRPVKAAEPEQPLPYIVRRQLVYYRTTYAPGTIILAKSQYALYVVKPNQAAIRYTMAVGSDCANAAGLYRVARRDGADRDTEKTLYLSESAYRIRGTDQARLIGLTTGAGGFQLVRDDMNDLSPRVPDGTQVVVQN